MSIVDGQSAPGGSPSSEPTDLKPQEFMVPVADVDRSKAFNLGLNWSFVAEFSFENDFRVLRFPPPGPQCSVQFGTHITGVPPGSAHGKYLITSSIEAGRDEPVSRGTSVSRVFSSGAPGAQLDPDGTGGRVSGRDPDHKTYISFPRFKDLDRNSWLLDEVAERLLDRLNPSSASFNSADDLVDALHSPESPHAEHDKRVGRTDSDWLDWHAEYKVSEQIGRELPV